MLEAADMTTRDEADRRLEQAMDWLMQLRDAPADPALRSRIDLWIAEEPGHARAWEQANNAWRLLGELQPSRAPERMRERSSVLRRVFLGAAAAMAACVVLAFAPSLLMRIQADQVTMTGELRRVTLADGTRVHLGPQSAIRARYTPDRRMVSLLAGEAFFEVSPDPERPFVVDAGGLDVSVTGTAFDVRLAPAFVSVAVRSGAVGVRYGRIHPALDGSLAAGDRVIVDRETGFAVRDRVDPLAVASWRDGRLFVEDATIAEVVAEIGRYHTGWIIVAGDRLASQRVTGLYDLRDPGRALPALVQPFGGRVREVTPMLHILSAP